MKFTDFNLHPDVLKGLAQAEYYDCMPVQEQVLTHAFSGHDLYVQSQTGTGKTAAFLVIIFQRLLTEDLLAGKKALIMAPTRELAVQIEEEAKMLAKFLPFKTGSFYGGVGYTQQEKLLRENVQIMVGTPGRVLDLNKSGKMNLMDIAFLVLDEADRMFDMGFYPDLRKLIKVVPPADRRQTMLFSATLNAWVKNLAWEYTRSPFEIEIKPEVVTVEEVDQILYHVHSGEKMKLLLGILEREQPSSAIIFCNTKRYTEIIAKRLRVNGYQCEFIIGDLPQSRRLKVIDDIKAGKIKFLVATDVAARGLDIEGLAMVVNYDLPSEAENYVHRIGRTARAGKTGRAISLVSEQDVYELPAIERYIGRKLPSEVGGSELHAADKSAGHYIHSEVYEDLRDSNRRDSNRGNSSRRDSSQRDSSRRDNNRRDSSQRDSSRRDSSRRDSSRDDNNQRDNSRRDSSRGGEKRAPRHSNEGRSRDGGRRQDMGTRPKAADRNGKQNGRKDTRNTVPPNTEFPKNKMRKSTGSADDLSRMSQEERLAFYRNKYAPGVKQKDVQQEPQEKPVPVKKGFLSKIKNIFIKN